MQACHCVQYTSNYLETDQQQLVINYCVKTVPKCMYSRILLTFFAERSKHVAYVPGCKLIYVTRQRLSVKATMRWPVAITSLRLHTTKWFI
jgi:hypothetical protein